MRVAGIAAALMLNAAALHATGNRMDYLKGDVNGDGSVTVTDVTVLVDIILNMSGTTTYPMADVNNDGIISITDVTELVDIILSNNITEEDDIINVPVEGDDTTPPGGWGPAQSNQGNWQD